MNIAESLSQLSKRLKEHREFLLTEEAAKTALVMPLLQTLGYDIFNPSEVTPEFTCDVGTKKGEKVDYAICMNGQVVILIECKPANNKLSINNASQLFRYFATTSARLAILTNGADWEFYTDLDQPNVMDSKPFFKFNLATTRKSDLNQLSTFHKSVFDLDKIVFQAGVLKLQTQVYAEVQNEFEAPSDDLVKIIAQRVQGGRFTAQVRETYAPIISSAFDLLIRNKVKERLETAISNETTSLPEGVPIEAEPDIVTTPEEMDGFNIVRAIAARVVDPARIYIRDAKSYCAVLLDDNNRKPIARLHFNSETTKYLGTFVDREETRHSVEKPIDIYQFEKPILERINALL